MADPVETVARTICARELQGFCTDIGQSMGCLAGRGAMSCASNCKATIDQLIMSGRMETARQALAALAAPPANVAAMRVIEAARYRSTRGHDGICQALKDFLNSRWDGRSTCDCGHTELCEALTAYGAAPPLPTTPAEGGRDE